MIGQKFERLTVIKECLEKPTHIYCDCSCGTKNKLVDKKSLKYNRVKSCGCLQKETISKLHSTNPDNLINKKFTRLTVMNVVGKNKYGFYEYLCKCDCGNEKIIMRNSLMSGKTQSCGCLNKEKSPDRAIVRMANCDKDFIGKTFGMLKVISRSEIIKDNDDKFPYICRCECGNEKIISKGNLVSGRTSSCGCYNSRKVKERHKNTRESFDYHQYIGSVFGRLTIINYIGFEANDDPRFDCQCSCGNDHKNVRLHNLTSPTGTRSCGCIRKEIISEGLDEYAKITNRRERGKFVRSEVRKLVLERDKHKCYLCKMEDRDLHVHHIEQWKDSSENRYSCKNLITLCFDCHFFEAHGNIGQINLTYVEKFKNYTKEQTCICSLCNLVNQEVQEMVI